tara:strand:- start:823 stop:1281 length:459 start_codon:yes stop_codon:yes gene_type:complete
MGLILIITGAVLFYRVETIVKRPQYNLKIPIEEFLDDITEWVRTMYPTRRKSPRVVVSTLESDNAGEYDYHHNEITIYLKNNPTIEILVDTQIHESIHHVWTDTKLKQLLFERQLEEYGYWNHPNEILCRSLAKSLTERYMKSRFQKNWVWL